jgi:membrane dipeptidase
LYCRVPTGLEDVSKYVELFSALYASGKWTIEELKRLAGLNFLRVFKEVEKVRCGTHEEWIPHDLV